MKRKIIMTLTLLLLIAGFFYFFTDKVNAPQNDQTITTNVDQNTNSSDDKKDNPDTIDQPKPEFDKSQYSLTNPDSIWVIVNKQRPLDAGYVPELTTASGGQVRSVVSSDLSKLLADASEAGVPMQIISSYRSYATQQTTYQGWVNRDGVALADTYSARPGHSEHQTGLAVDLGNGTCDLEACFGQTNAGKWLEQNAHEYGFVIRYSEGKQSITGYQYEPWHLRYVGKELAEQINKKPGQTLEEFFGLPPAPNY